MYEILEFRPRLVHDMEENNTVKLYIRRAPWELTGVIKKVNKKTFKILTGVGLETYRISDIIYYERV